MPPVITPVVAPTAPGFQGTPPVTALPNNGGAPAVNTNYFKAPTETIPEYNARAADYNKTKNAATAAPASEPAVISSSSVDDEIAATKSKLSDMGKKGSTIDPATSTMTYADGSLVPPAQETTTEDPNSAKNFYGDGTDQNPGDADWVATKALFAPLKANLDADTLSQVTAIEQQFDALRTQQESANANATQSRMTALMNAGGRYAPANSSGVLLATTSYGIQKIHALDVQENMALAQARTAQQSGDMQLMTSAITMAEKARTDKQAAAAKVAATLQTATEKASQAALQASRDTAIGDLVAQGVTDPTDLLNYLNYHEDGTQVGDFTADEVSKTLKALTVDGNASKLPADVQTFNYLKDNGYLPTEITSLPPSEQYFEYIAQLKAANTAPKTTKAPKSTPSDSSDTPSQNPSWEQYKSAAAKAMGVNYLPAAEEDNLRAQYDTDFPADTGKPFTATELKKLEQAGLSNATRKAKLDYLYGKKPTTPKETPAPASDLPPSLQ